jgi:hypothetical protein
LQVVSVKPELRRAFGFDASYRRLQPRHNTISSSDTLSPSAKFGPYWIAVQLGIIGVIGAPVPPRIAKFSGEVLTKY